MIFGDFIQNLAHSQEYLILSFSPSSIPLQNRWRNNCLSADFLADYLSTFFFNSDEFGKNPIEIKSAISYIANELLENAMKYSNIKSKHPISIQVYLNFDVVIFQVTNSLSVEKSEKFIQYIHKLTNSDIELLYLDVLEQNALDKNQENSGLGFLTMLNDYNAKLGWRFEALPQESTEMTVTTMVRLQI